MFDKETTVLMQYPIGNERTSYSIPNSVIIIDEKALQGSVSLVYVTIPKSVTSIGNYAFQYCGSLTSVAIPDSVTSIGERAFDNCVSLANITIPDSVISIDRSSFYGTALYNDDTNWEDNVLYIDKHLIVARDEISENYEVRPGTVTIADNAFENCTSLTGVTIPDGVESIGDSAFYGCTGLVSVTIPDSVTHIGISTFLDTALYNDETNWADNILYIGNHLIRARNTISGNYEVKPGTVSIAGSAFYYCYNLSGVVIPDSVRGIGNSAFCDCESLSGIVIPDNVTSIGNSAFSGCGQLKNFVIPDNVTSIGYRAFYECDNLARVYYIGSESGWGKISIADGNDRLLQAKIRYNTTFADDFAYTVDKGSVTIVGYVGNAAEMIIPTKIDGKSVTSIGKMAFEDCTSLTSVTIPDSVKTIDIAAFADCDGLRGVVIPNSMMSIGDYAFNCNLANTYYAGSEKDWATISIGYGNGPLTNNVLFNSLLVDGIGYKVDGNNLTVINYIGNATEVVIPAKIDRKSVTGIGDSTFCECTGLVRATMGNGVTSIGYRAFYECPKLVGVVIPASVTSIGYSAFECDDNRYSNLVNICYGGSESDWKDIYILGDNNNLLFNTRFHYNSVIDGDLVYTVGDGSVAIVSCVGRSKEMVIPAKIEGKPVTSIGYCAFDDYSSLESVAIPDSVTSIEEYAFGGCDSLTDVYYSGSESDWNEISIVGWHFQSLSDANIHYNSTGHEPANPEIKTVTTSIDAATGEIEVTVQTSSIPAGAALLAVGVGADGTMLDLAQMENGKAKLSGENVKTVKVFCWDSLESMRPLCEAKEVEVTQ